MYLDPHATISNGIWLGYADGVKMGRVGMCVNQRAVRLSPTAHVQLDDGSTTMRCLVFAACATRRGAQEAVDKFNSEGEEK